MLTKSCFKMNVHFNKIGLRNLVLMQLFLCFIICSSFKVARVKNADRIVGKWITVQKNLVVEVYKFGNFYKAKVVWFNDTDDLSRPMNLRTDYRNPVPELRSRKPIGMDVLRTLSYDELSNTWENGFIYDSTTGKEWSSYIYFTDNGILRVKGYWHLKCFCKTMDLVAYHE